MKKILILVILAALGVVRQGRVLDAANPAASVFRHATGLTLTEYVARLRVEHAKRLLGNPSVRVSEVAFATGFSSISQFNTVFRKTVGLSPTQFRNGHTPNAATVA